MDPNETLRILRKLFSDWEDTRGAHGSVSPEVMEQTLDDLRDHWQALDGWLSGGGFLPDAWLSAFNERTSMR